jgi:Tfp pilus assembly protein PilN
MIKVNLLPPEYRKVDGPPVARLVALVVGAALTAGSIGAWGYVRLNLLSEAVTAREALDEELAQVKAQAERSAALLSEFKEYQKRRDTIEKIGQSRLLWSRKLDELADVVHNKGDTKQYMVWLGTIRTQAARRADSGAALHIEGQSAGDKDGYTRLSDFNKAMKETKDFSEDLLGVDPPTGRQVTFPDKKWPSKGWQFQFVLDLKKPNWRETQ